MPEGRLDQNAVFIKTNRFLSVTPIYIVSRILQKI
jgi:hypothetical protein